MATSPYDILHIYYLEGKITQPWKIDFRAFAGNWEEEGYTFLFFTRNAEEQIRSLLTRQPHLKLLDTYTMTYEEWQGGKIQPCRIGRFAFTPPWCREAEEAPVRSDDILLDPGVVFGNGLHPTTQDCLAAMEMAADRGGMDTVLDLGTGTGVLALAAVKLGCRRCLALDFNHLAARTALNNVHINGLEKQILVCQGRAEELIAIPADLLVANIHFDVMRHLVTSKEFLAKSAFILSGLLRTEARLIAETLSELPVEVMRMWEQDGIWHTFYGERRT